MTTQMPVHVVIAGGGVAGLEAMMALRALAVNRVRITLLAPNEEFRYRPMTVAEPFTIAAAQHLPLATIASDFGAELVTGALAAVDAAERIRTHDGAQIRAGVTVAVAPRHPVLRGVLMTGRAPRFLEARLAADGVVSSTVSDTCPWDPPTKIVARHLGPYLDDRGRRGR